MLVVSLPMLVDVALVVALAELARAASGSLAQHGSAPAQSPWALAPGGRPSSGGSGSGICPPKLWYDDFELHSAAPNDMVLHPLHISGGWSNRVDLTFFADGCEFQGVRLVIWLKVWDLKD